MWIECKCKIMFIFIFFSSHLDNMTTASPRKWWGGSLVDIGFGQHRLNPLMGSCWTAVSGLKATLSVVWILVDESSFSGRESEEIKNLSWESTEVSKVSLCCRLTLAFVCVQTVCRQPRISCLSSVSLVHIQFESPLWWEGEMDRVVEKLRQKKIKTKAQKG